MSRKDFEAIAAMLNTMSKDDSKDTDTLAAVTFELAKICKAANPAFKADRFVKAAGFPAINCRAIGGQ